MTPIQLELTKLIGSKELSFGCMIKHNKDELLGYPDSIGKITHSWEGKIAYISENIARLDFIDEKHIKEIIGHPATLDRFHRWMNEKKYIYYKQYPDFFYISIKDNENNGFVYDPSKDLLEQDENVLKKIIELVKNNQ